MPIWTENNDSIQGTSGNDVIDALGGDDYIFASGGIDQINGGTGIDQIVIARGALSWATGPRTYTLTSSSLTASDGAINSSITSIEKFSFNTTGGTGYNDTIDASGFVSSYSGIVGDFQLAEGNNTVIGSSGSDYMFLGSTGSNTINGGGGYDVVYKGVSTTNPATVYVTNSGGAVLVTQGAVQNSFTAVENLNLSAGGNTGTVTIDASACVTGMYINFNDHNGSDVFIGSSGINIFVNRSANQAGSDVFTGNGGADQFSYTYGAGGMNGDIITDLSAEDFIDLRYNNPTQNAGGYLAYLFIGNAPFSGVAGQYRYEAVGGQTLLQVDSNGDGIADQVLTIANGAFALGETTYGPNILQITGPAGPPANRAPTDLALSDNAVLENAADGTVIGTLSATDPDSGDTLSYSLVDDAGGRFMIDGDQIVVADGTLLDYETNTSHSVTVRVTDTGGLTYDEALAISVGDFKGSVTGYQPVGSEFLVNSATLNNQFEPTITGLVGGGFVVSWSDGSTAITGDPHNYNVKAQIFAPDGSPVGGEFVVNSNTPSFQALPAVTGLAGGGFVISWTDGSLANGYVNSTDIRAQIFAADGSPVGGEFQVNSTIFNFQELPTITGLAGGGFVISWNDGSSGVAGNPSGTDVRAQIFAPDGSRIGGEFLVNSTTSNFQDFPTITGLTGGGFVISWSDASGIGGDSSGLGIKAQIFGPDGSRIGGEFLVNSTTSNYQEQPTISALDGGGFVVSWADYSGGGNWGIKAQIFAPDGSPVGGEFLVNSATLANLTAPAITGIDGGGFVISWVAAYGMGAGSSEFGIHAQVFAADGSPVDSQFMVNSVANTGQIQPTITRLDGGGFVISWSDNSGTGGDPSGYGIKAQIYAAQYSEANDPPVVQDDAFTTNELSLVNGNLFADNGSGADSDPDGPALAISAVNGSTADVGNQITLPSGALLTVNADGTFSYDPNGAFEFTPTPGSGASNTPSSDSFTYTLAGGGTATVALTITGADNNDYILGTAGNNSLTGGPGNDTMYGGDGDDRMVGSGGNDEIHGEDGVDYITGGNGDDLIDGGAGIDRAGWYQANAALGGVTVSLLLQGAQYTGSQGWDTLSGIENLSGTPFADVLTGDAGDNWLWGSAATIDVGNVSTTNHDTLDGQGGNDLLTVGIGNHTLIGGSDVDTVRFTENGAAEPGITIQMFAQGAAQDTGAGMWTLTGIENLSGGTGNDSFEGNNVANVLAGYLGDDGLWGYGGDDVLLGDGSINVDANGVITTFLDSGTAGGNDSLYGGGGNDTLYGGAGLDALYAGPGNDLLYGGDGNDFLNGNTGDDLLDGGAGFDRAAFYTGAVSGVTVDLRIVGAQDTGVGLDTLINVENVSGTSFADTLTGDDNDNWLWGSSAWNGATLISTANDDTIDGGGGNDLLTVGQGNHNLTGGAGVDTVAFGENSSSAIGVTVSLALQGAVQSTGAGDWTLNEIENLSGHVGNDTLTGDGGANVLAGHIGDDSLSGGDGDDTLYGDGEIGIDFQGLGGSGPIMTFTDLGLVGAVGGNDTLEGGDGDDQLWGGGGTDTASYASASGGVQAYLYDDGFGEAVGAAGYDQLHDIENLTGSAFNDGLGGNNGANLLDGGDGHDGLRGNAGDDTLLGGNGDDFLSGGLGNDVIDGGDGFDRISHYTDATSGVTVDLGIAGPQDTGQGWDTLIGIEHVSGTLFGDTLIGDDGDNVLWGSASTFSPGNIATTNNDTLIGGGGNDLLWVGIGNHVADGGSGIDTFRFNENGAPETGITLSLLLQGEAQASGNGSWTLTGIENLSGSIAGDFLTGDGNANVLAGDLGDDLLSGGAGNDTLYGDGAIAWDGHGTGGSGPITTYADATSLTVGAVAGNDTLEGGDGDDQLWGGGGNDTASYASAGGGVTALLYNSGFGEATGAAGYDQLHDIENLEGSAFNDILYGNNLDNVVAGGDGHDEVRGRGGNDIVLGGNGDDFLNGGLGDDVIDGGDGIDRVAFYTDATGGVTVDLNLQGVAQDTGQGMDTLTNIENLSGTAFGDTLIGDGGDNVLWGSASTLNGIVATTNNDTLSGGGGNDLLVVGIGNHVVDGGAGSDTFRFSENGAPETGITLSLLLQGAAQASGNGDWALTGIENLSGSIAGDTLIGDGNANVLAGDLGDDNLIGGGGNDVLYGDGQINWDDHGTGRSGPITTYADATGLYVGGVSGNDILEGGLGNDQLYGGGGIDTASYASASGAVDVAIYDGGFGEAFGAAGYDQLHDIENLAGSAFNDALTGNGQANILSGADGDDTLRGNGGSDSLLGGDGTDFLNGGFGDDVIEGGAGFDRAAHYQTNAALGGVTVSLLLQGSAQNTGQGIDYLTGIENLSGTPFADSLTGDAGNNWLWGSPATIGVGNVSATNNDMLDGGDGDDMLWAGIGNHTLIGGTGIDTLQFTENGSPETSVTVSLAVAGMQVTGSGNWALSGIENLSGGSQNDALTGDSGANVLAGNLGDDILSGGGGNDILLGDGRIDFSNNNVTVNILDSGASGGNDLLEGGLGDDVLNGGGGIDTATYANAGGGVTVNLGSGTAFGADGNDTLVNIENVTGSQFGDSLTGNGDGNVIDGLGGNDTLTGGAGDDTLYGGDGDDFLQGDLGENNITVTGNDVLDGGNGNDLLRGGLGDDQFYGGANNDQFRGNGGVDYFDGGDDDGVGVNGIGDRVSFFEQRATQGVVADLRTGIISNDGFGNVETMVGIESLGGDTAYVDTFYGNDGSNYLAGNRGDYLYGFGGDDLFQLISAATVIDGGSGIDRLTVFVTATGLLLPDTNGDGFAEFAPAATAGWSIDLAAGTTLDGYGNIGTVTGIENVDGTSLADAITGDANANVLNGFDGNDLLSGGAGNDTIDGGNGTDTASYANASGGVTVTLTTTGGSSSGADGNDILLSIENVIGSAFNDTLTGNDGNNMLVGGAGNDTLNGGTGIDTIDYSASSAAVSVNLASGKGSGGDANGDTISNVENVIGSAFQDKLIGNLLSNVLNGGANNDQLTGGGGVDTLLGGGGSDLFIFTAIADFGTAGNYDWIMDFDAGGLTAATQVDRIDLSAIDAISKTANKNDPFTYIGTAQFSNSAGQLRYDAAAGTLSGDVNGDGIADFSLNIIVLGTLNSTDFIL